MQPQLSGHSLDLMGYYKSTTHKLETTHESSRNPILIMLCFNVWIDWMSHQNQILDDDNANISIIYLIRLLI